MSKTILVAVVAAALTTAAARADDSKTLYESACAKCHGVDGKGQTKMGKRLGAKDYTDPKVQSALTDDAALKAIKDGLKKDDKTLMKPAEGMTGDQMKGLVTYMRTFKK
jgi:cytochrome c553